MKRLFMIVGLLIILSLVNQGYCYPILEETDDEIIMQNSWVVVKLSKNTGGISSVLHWRPDIPYELLTDTAYITIRDKRNDETFRQSEGKVTSVSTGGPIIGTVWAIFDIHFPQDSAYAVKIKYTLDIQALHWDAKLQRNVNPDTAWEANIDFSFPVIANMKNVLWSRKDAPFKLPIRRTVTYRRKEQYYYWPVAIPAMIFYDDSSDVGLSVVSPFEMRKPGLEWQMMDSSFIISNYYLRLRTAHPCSAGVYIVPHEGDWRPGFAWMHDKYSTYFDPVCDTVLRGEGWGMILHSWFINDYSGILEDAKERSVTWVSFYDHMPFAGLYAPDKDSWIIVQGAMSYDAWVTDSAFESLPHTDYDSNRTQIDSLHNYDIQTYLYFQSSESWTEYTNEFFSDQYATDANGYPIPAWQYCYLMNPDPNINSDWGKHIDSQVTAMLDKYPNMRGIFYDRPDYCDYDYAHDDGTTMIDSHPVYMLGFAQEKMIDAILKKIHPPPPNNNKGIWANWPTSIEVCKGMDGIQSEDVRVAAWLQYLGITRPLVVASWMDDTTPTNTEDKLRTALYTGHYPAILRPDNMSKMNREDSIIVKDIEKRYRPLFATYKGKKWVLYPHALQLPEDIKGNIFQTPDTDYLVPMADLDKFSTKLYIPESIYAPFRYDIFPRIQVPDSQAIKYCYILSGDYKGINQDTVYSNPPQANNEKRTHAHRVSSLVQLTKKPRYEITRISSPVLVRGDTEEFIIRVQNMETDTINYKLNLITPFDSNSFSFPLLPDSNKDIGLNFWIDTLCPLGETTLTVIKVIDNDTTEIILTSWIADFLQFDIPDSLLFIHYMQGETIPFILINNTEDTLNVTLSGEFLEGAGEIGFPDANQPSQDFIFYPLEAKGLKAFIRSDYETGVIKISAEASRGTIEITRRLERTMSLNDSDNLFVDDFSIGDMRNWDIVSDTGSWKVVDSVARGNKDAHWAWANVSVPPEEPWTDYKFQVNTKLEGSTDPFKDWYESFIFFRYQNDTNYYRFGIAGMYGSYNAIVLGIQQGIEWTLLASTPFNAKKNVIYNLRVEVKGDSIKGFLDGNQVISVEYDTYSSGIIGIGVPWDSMVIYYDDVVVRKLQH
jgi:hypothetical protein